MRTPTLTLSGFNCSIRVRSGHLEVTDGAFFERTSTKLPRVRHGIQHIILLGAYGYLTLSALEWMRGMGISLSILDRRGHVLSQVIPSRPSDAHLRRAQHRATESGLGLKLAKDLIARKLQGQERIVRERLAMPHAANQIAVLRNRVSIATSIVDLRSLEAIGAKGYWRCWRALPIPWSRQDAHLVPVHWLTFGSRISPLGSRLSPRHAINPPNAILNYLYTLLESQSRIAAVGAGFDPGLGLLHADSKQRDSLALDIMEPSRPLVDALVLDLMAKGFARKNFAEDGTGQCWLKTTYCRELARSAEGAELESFHRPIGIPWQSYANDIANHIANELAKSIPKATSRPKRGRDIKKRRA